MRPLPDYLPYGQAHPPRAKRWLSVGALLSIASGSGVALSSAAKPSFSLMSMGIICSLALTGISWMIRLLYYRMSLHNARYYEQLVEQDRQEWWANHRQTFALSEMVLLGPVGSETAHWQRLLRREHQAPKEKTEPGGQALRLIHSFTSDPEARERQLATMLARQWLSQRRDSAPPVLSHCYWLGSESAWHAFCQQIGEDFPALPLPETAEKWQGEASLSAITKQLSEADDECLILIAGCQSLIATPDLTRPAGESAVLWLASRNGPAQLCRGEVYDAGLAENILDVCKRAMEQSHTEQPPDPCILFTQPETPELTQSGWNVMQYLQDANWGEPGKMEALIVITLAAMYVAQYQQPCAWIARDPLHTLALGIIKPDKAQK
ncbi:hypothetical protein [Atlantibacter hermannii]|uniref:hypothetical protein n=1 Tax=Atlantibacter hermannii TaxID=565 RepID=UPI0019346181|nr:hypothetical protein [Atlantibacter hermannii]MBL7634238.1 hypothetical protein [Atlantibacter hermannii]MBL7674695.1 hypothetical protein [Atlantibacter hermannii]